MKQSKPREHPGVFFDDTSKEPPRNLEAAYRTAEDLAWKNLAACDPATQQRRCQAAWEDGCWQLDFFNRRLTVSPKERSVLELASGQPLGVWERVLVLHYLASPIESAREEEELIDFRRVPAGGFYFDAYQRRSLMPLARTFGKKTGLLLEAGRALGGEAADFGDAAVRLWPFARVPVVAAVYAADEEFPAAANLLFLPSITSYLCTEDIAVLGGLVAGRLVREARRLESAR